MILRRKFQGLLNSKLSSKWNKLSPKYQAKYIKFSTHKNLIKYSLYHSTSTLKNIEKNSKIVLDLDEASVRSNDISPIPTYRVINEDGEVLNGEHNIQLDDDIVVKIYKQMLCLNEMDQILYDIQRQGRISFYMTAFGEEATHFGSASALDPEDIVFAQYREAGVLMWRGFTLEDFCNQCYGNVHDGGKGRQMPVHYGSKKLNFQTISSPLATQLPQAAGCAYALKLEKKNNICICYFGEGAASEGDFHAALNFASTLECPVVFFCRNNGYAISTPTHEQYRGDGIGGRGIGYGIYTIRVDGNDLFAVHNATKRAREYALKNNRPVLIEAMTYRVGHHSTSDDSTRYRSKEEIEQHTGTRSPIHRTRRYLERKELWNEELEKETKKEARKNVLNAVKFAESQPKPPMDDLFNDVYDEYTPNLTEQKNELDSHLEKYSDVYHLDQYAKQ